MSFNSNLKRKLNHFYDMVPDSALARERGERGKDELSKIEIGEVGIWYPVR